MKLFIVASLIISSNIPAQMAFAYMSENTYRVGNNTYTNGYGADGYNYNINTYNVGNNTYSNGYDNRGNSVNCTSYKVGNNVYKNCY